MDFELTRASYSNSSLRRALMVEDWILDGLETARDINKMLGHVLYRWGENPEDEAVAAEILAEYRTPSIDEYQKYATADRP